MTAIQSKQVQQRPASNSSRKLTVAAGATATIPNATGFNLIIQSDPANTSEVRIRQNGGTAGEGIVLIPGASINIPSGELGGGGGSLEAQEMGGAVSAVINTLLSKY